MRDDDKRSTVRRQRLLQRFRAGNIQMIRRLIEQDQLRAITHQCHAQQQFAHFSLRWCFTREQLIGVSIEACHSSKHLAFELRRQIEHCAHTLLAFFLADLLRQIVRRNTRADSSIHLLQQRGFACTIAPDNADMLLRSHSKFRLLGSCTPLINVTEKNVTEKIAFHAGHHCSRTWLNAAHQRFQLSVIPFRSNTHLAQSLLRCLKLRIHLMSSRRRPRIHTHHFRRL